ncbi:hypothetical protein [Streptomyces violaceusniger]|uniref:Uncharacterized protein n=1 Tax=Streptomyces violaceusniger (strain Tu 4113) TaxID=653045 RepID=G2PGR9_STRV4|nr:hypothetical protein [Streptomyces violaceusniger]AEM88565.1 hypothetical protein Strvi_9281 [Streptomyces violaceusniger Tu 4113]
MTANQRPRSTSGDRELRLWKVGWALAVTFVAAVLVAGGVFYGLVYLLDFQEIDSTAKLDDKTLFDLVKLSFGVVAGAGALVAALVVAYRRQRIDEAGAHREATQLHTERFGQAVEQLGSDSPAVRLGGVHALAGLADDALDDSLRQTCIDVLCAYLQLPSRPTPVKIQPTKRNTTATWPSARSATRSCASSATTTAAPGEPTAHGRAATSTSLASSSTATWTSRARAFPAARCRSAPRQVQLPLG